MQTRKLSPWTLSIATFVTCLFLIGCTEAPVGTKSRPFTMYFVPSVDAEAISKGADEISKFVSKRVSQTLYGKDTGFYVKSSVPTSYVAVVEAFGTKKADFAALTTFSYILGKDIKKYDLEALLTVIRGKNEHTYKAQFIAHRDSGIKKLEDLKGKKFAFTDPASTAGYIMPSKLLKERNIPLGETIFAQKHDNVVTMIYQRQVDAGATFYSPPEIVMENGKKVEKPRDARQRVEKQFPDVYDKIKIIGFTDEIPNDPWVIRGNLDPDAAKAEAIKKSVAQALIDFAKTEAGAHKLKEMYSITGFNMADDKTYVAIRKTVLESNLDLEKHAK